MILDKLAYIWNPCPKKWKPRNKNGLPIFDYRQRKENKRITEMVKTKRFIRGENPNKRFAIKAESRLDMTGNTS